MKVPVAVLTGFALLVSSPLLVLGQSTTPPAQSPPTSPGQNVGVIEGLVTKVDPSCAGRTSGAADCQAVVEVMPAAAPGGSGTPSGTGYTSSGANTQGTTKITIPKSVRIADQRGENSASPPHPPGSQLQIAKGDRVKINYEKKPDGGNVATVITILKPAS